MIRAILNKDQSNEIKVTDRYFSWDSRQNVLSRSQTYHGIIISESLDVSFIGDAYDYLLDLDDTYDVAATCTIDIQVQDNKSNWLDDFTGYIDFTTKKEDTTGATKKITYNCYSTDFANKLLERENISIPYDRLETLDEETITPFTNEYGTVQIIGMPVADTNIQSEIPVDEELTYSA